MYVLVATGLFLSVLVFISIFVHGMGEVYYVLVHGLYIGRYLYVVNRPCTEVVLPAKYIK